MTSDRFSSGHGSPGPSGEHDTVSIDLRLHVYASRWLLVLLLTTSFSMRVEKPPESAMCTHNVHIIYPSRHTPAGVEMSARDASHKLENFSFRCLMLQW